MTQETEGWAEEKRSAYLYRVLAGREDRTERAALFRELAQEAERQAAIWARLARERGRALPEEYRPDVRTRLVAALVRWLGVRPLRGVLAAMKVRGMSLYSHPVPGHSAPLAGEALEHRHRAVAGGGNLRAAVFGANDGLVSNACLIFGVAGATADSQLVLLSGVAGLIAGAFSMAAGEYVSVRSQREMYEYQIALEREELEHYPEAEAEELALIYQARGHTREEAASLARRLVADPQKALAALAREELGLNPEELGSPWGAAGFSFVSFAAGAAVPLVPFLAGAGPGALPASIAATAVALFAVGALLSLFTGRSAAAGGTRMLAIGALAGGFTYLVGRLLGVALV